MQISESLSHRLNGLAKLRHHRFDGVGVGPLHVARTEPCACKVALGSCCLLHDALGDSLTHRQSCRLQTVSIEKNLVLSHDLKFTSESRLQILTDLGRVDVVLAGDVAHSGFELLGNVDGFSGLSAKTFHGHGRSCDRLQNIFHLALPAVLQLACKLDSIGCGIAHQDTCLAEGLVEVGTSSGGFGNCGPKPLHSRTGGIDCRHRNRSTTAHDGTGQQSLASTGDSPAHAFQHGLGFIQTSSQRHSVGTDIDKQVSNGRHQCTSFQSSGTESISSSRVSLLNWPVRSGFSTINTMICQGVSSNTS